MGYSYALRSTENVTKAIIILPNNLRETFYRHSKNIPEHEMDLCSFESWLDDKIKEFYNPIANIIAAEEKGRERKDKSSKQDNHEHNRISSFNAKTDTKQDDTQRQMTCWFCSEDHKIWNCTKFTQKTIEDRRKDAKDLKLCYNCLSKGHNIKACKSRILCKTCNKKHHTLLHDENFVTSSYASQRKAYLQVIPIVISNGKDQ